MGNTEDCPVPAYHERQRLQRCLQHSVNNLLQRPAVSCADLDDLANQLAPGRALQPVLHPHRTWWLGNWDVNVLELALRRHGKELQWHDLRDATFERLDLDSCFGLILNIRADGVLTRLLGGRHWTALRSLGGRWWNLDSNLPAPLPVASCCNGGKQVSAAWSAGLGTVAPAHMAGTPGQTAAAAAAAAAAAVAATADATDGQAGLAEAAAVAGSRGSQHVAPQASAAEGPSRSADAAAADRAAVRQFLVQQVRDRDAKVFCVLESPLASHPLPPAALPSHPLPPADDECSRSAGDLALPTSGVSRT